MAFKHLISFATNLDANFGCYWFRIMPDIVSKLLRSAIWSHCAVLLESEQTPFTWICYFAQNSIWNMLYSSYVILVGNNFSPIPSTMACSHENKSELSMPYIYKALKLFWLSNWVSIARVVACFPQVGWSLPAACLCSPVWPAQAVLECCPKSLAIDFAVKTFNCLLD